MIIKAMIKIITSFNNYSKSILRKLVPSYVGMIRVKAGRPLVNHMLKMVLLVRGSIETSLVKVIISYVRFLHSLYRKNGSAFIAKYLKASTSLLMQAISGTPHKASQELGIAVSRTGRGLPRFIPAVHRIHIRNGSLFHIRLWLSLISVYRVLDFVGKLSVKTIVAPSKANVNFDEVKQAVIDLKIRENLVTPSSGILTPFWISSSSPTSTKCIRDPLDKNKILVPSGYSTSIGSMILAAYAWSCNSDLIKPYLYVAKSLKLGGPIVNFMGFIEFCKGSFKFPFTLVLHDSNYKFTKPFEYHSTYEKDSIPLGKLAFKPEPAGKVRVFAMADCFTQWLMKPIHDALFNWLATMDTDATFDQNKSVRDFAQLLNDRKITKIYSFDLTAATDRMPVVAQACVLTHSFWMGGLGEAWMAILVNRWYKLPFPEWDPSAVLAKRLGFDPDNLPENVQCTKFMWKGRLQSFVTAVKYAVGQPMGALSSWAMLAVLHHVMVAIAARRVNMVGFRLYRVLGDDLVIADEAVANSYLNLAREWDMEINLSKSVLSDNGSFEFAKQFYYKYNNVSGLSFKEMAVARWDVRALFQLFKRIKTFRDIRISEMLSFLGHGYKALSRITANYDRMGNGMRRALLLASAPGFDFSAFTFHEDWLKSTGFNKFNKLIFPKEAKDEMIKSIVQMAGKFPTYKLPTSRMNFFDLVHKHLMYDKVLDFISDKGNKEYKLVEHTRLIKGDKFNPSLKEPFEPFIMQFAWTFKPLFDILWTHFNEKITKTRYEFRSHHCLKDQDLTNLWMSYDRIEAVSSEIASLSQFRTIKDVQTLGNSKMLRNAFNVRKTMLRFANEKK